MEVILMASIKKRGSVWQARVTWQDETGRHSKSQSGFRTKVEAVTYAQEMEVNLSRGAKIASADRPLVWHFHRWWTTYKQGHNAPITEERYGLIERQLDAYFHDAPLSDITPTYWQQFINDFSAGKDRVPVRPRSRDTVQKLNGYVRAMVKRLVNEQVLYTDFTFDVELHKDRTTEESVKYLELPDFKAVTEYAHDHARFTSLSTLAAYVATQTGLRVSEVLGLTWPDIDAEQLTLSVKRTWDYSHTKEFAPTKNASSVRTIAIPQSLVEVLGTVHSQQAAWMMKNSVRDERQCIFFGNLGKVITATSCSKTLNRIQEQCKIPDNKQITFHGLRHTHVSYLLSKGVDIYYISKRLGHANVAITLKVYSHLLDTFKKEQETNTIKALSEL
jgi:integrase